MYEPRKNGTLKLVGAQFLSFNEGEGAAVALARHVFIYSGSPNRYGLPAFYELHVWAWKNSPWGIYANPRVSCRWQPLTSQ